MKEYTPHCTEISVQRQAIAFPHWPALVFSVLNGCCTDTNNHSRFSGVKKKFPFGIITKLNVPVGDESGFKIGF